MSLSRRDFVKLCSFTVGGLGISQLYRPELAQAVDKAAKNQPVIWLQGQGCTGCSVSLLNSVHPSIKEVLLKIISLESHYTLMAAEGKVTMEHMFAVAEEYKDQFFLVVEGSIPMEEGGKYCFIGEHEGQHVTMLEATRKLGQKAAATMAVGACAAFGGIPAARGNVTGASPVTKVYEQEGIETPLINVAGCPPHPDWMVGTLAHVLLYDLPELDSDLRPALFFGRNIHENCPYRSYYEAWTMSQTFTQEEACRYELGCKGPFTNADCWKRKWNNGVNWCVENAVCIGCVQSGFPDAVSPFYEAM